MAAKDKLSALELRQLAILMDPASWGMTTLRDPKNPRKPLRLRDYQINMLRTKTVRKVSRCGRRVGKTLTMCVHILWYAFTHENSKQVIATPYDSQIQLIFEMLKQFIEATPELRQSVDSITKSPNVIKLLNGSIIKGFTAGTRSGAGGGSLRGQAADWLYMDEVDYMTDDDFETIYAIALEAPERIGVWISSTPTGRRGKFYNACQPDSGWHEFYYPTTVNPEWSDKMDKELRNMYSAQGYVHEVLAEFGDETIGVFSKAFIDRARRNYQYQAMPLEKHIRMIGVDWDKYQDATQIVVMDYVKGEDRFRVLNRIEIAKSEFTFDNAVKKIIELNEMYKPDGIYIDRGHGEYQVEVLRKFGLAHKDTGLHKKIRPVHFSEVKEVIDPFTKKKDKKPVKHLMVNQLQILFERDKLILNDNDEMITRQLENYQVVRRTIKGEPIFTSEDEHTIDCIGLCILGFMEKFPQIIDFMINAEVATMVKQIKVANFANERSHLDRGWEQPEERIEWDEPTPKPQVPVPLGFKPESKPAKKKASAGGWAGRGSNISRPYKRSKW